MEIPLDPKDLLARGRDHLISLLVLPAVQIHPLMEMRPNQLPSHSKGHPCTHKGIGTPLISMLCGTDKFRVRPPFDPGGVEAAVGVEVDPEVVPGRETPGRHDQCT